MPELVEYTVQDDAAVITINNPPVNALGPGVPEGIDAGVSRAAADPAVQAVVLIGAGNTFIAGADIKVFGTIPNRDVSIDRSHRIHALLRRIEDCPKPVVCAIHGTALGGGLEFAMACHYRVAVPTAKVGQPEVLLGIIPGAGGTQRLPRLCGVATAIEMCTLGQHIGAKRALAEGIIDQIIDQKTAGDLLTGAIAFARAKAAAGETRKVREQEDKIAEYTTAAAAIDAARANLKKTARGAHAPYAAVDAIAAGVQGGFEAGSAREIELFADCVLSAESRNLIRLFFAEREAAKVPGIPKDTPTAEIRAAAVVGAGTMGGGIAMNFANAGIPVQLLELSPEALERGRALIARNYAASVTRGSFSPARAEQAQALISGVSDYQALADADIVIEAVFEDLSLKQQVFARLDQVSAPHAILATNTSTLDIDAIAQATRRPQQVVGTHFFSPANVMKLLENVRGRATSGQTLATVMALGKILGKVAVLAGNCDGFIGNRMLMFYGAEAEFLLEEGATPEQIDRVIEAFGFAMGPLAVRDLAGNDVGWQIRKGRKLAPDERWSPILERLVAAGRLGQKSGRGFYRYEGRSRVPDPEVTALIEEVSRALGIQRRVIDDAEITERLLHPLVNEGARILSEGIALRAGDIDVVYVNGYGFPAYKGGPMFWGEQSGLARVIATMQRLSATHGARWRPAPLLEELVASGKGFASLVPRERS